MQTTQFHFLLADDDSDDRFFFEKAVTSLHPETRISFAEDGEKLMSFLSKNIHNLPDVLFLDLNMPRKNGSECLKEIRRNSKYDDMSVIIYSTSFHDHIADILYKNGADYYIRKPNLPGLKKVLHHILDLLVTENLARPERMAFLLKIA